MTWEIFIDAVIKFVPFLIYGLLLVKLFVSYQKIHGIHDKVRERKLTALIAMLALCTVLFMAANAYAIEFMNKTLLSIRVVQIFAIGNCLLYWLVIDFVSEEADLDGSD